MPKLVETKVGSRGFGDGASVEWLITFDDLLDGEYLTQAISKGLRLEAGEDFRVVNANGEDTELKTAAEKAAKELKLAVAERLNRPTTVRLPKTGADVDAADRQWLEFRPRDQFADEDAKRDYIASLV